MPRPEESVRGKPGGGKDAFVPVNRYRVRDPVREVRAKRCFLTQEAKCRYWAPLNAVIDPLLICRVEKFVDRFSLPTGAEMQ